MGNAFSKPGLLVPPLTPYTEDCSVDYDALADQIDYVIEECNPTAINVLGVEAQEYRFLTEAERRSIIEHTIECVDGRVPTIVGISHPSYEQAIELGQFASDLGAEALQILIPPRLQGGRRDLDEVIAYFESIGDGTDRPVLAYHNPRTGAHLDADEMIQLARVDCVAAFKESSRNLRHVLRLVEEVDRAGLARYYTTMEMLLITLLAGGSGATMPAPGAKIGSSIIEAVNAGDIERAVEYQRIHATYPAKWLDYGLAPVMKASLQHLGIDTGIPFPPTGDVDDDEGLETFLRETDVFSD